MLVSLSQSILCWHLGCQHIHCGITLDNRTNRLQRSFLYIYGIFYVLFPYASKTNIKKDDVVHFLINQKESRYFIEPEKQHAIISSLPLSNL